MSLLPVAAAAIAGAIAGSFIATLCVRWSRGEQATVGRSRCDSCNRELSVVELIPIVSWFSTRGRCRSCGARIPGLHLWIEIAAAALAAIAVALQPNIQGAGLALFWLLLMAPAVLDARHHWLPDPLILVLALAGLLVGGIATGLPLVHRLIGGAAGFLALWIVC